MFPQKILILLSALISFCNAHHMVTNFYVGGVNQGDGVYIRVPPNTNPITNPKSNDMACNVGGEKPLGRFCAVDAGQNVAVQWKTWPDGTVATPIDVSHQGPCSVYLKRVDRYDDQAAGAGWFKIFQYGYENGKFCTEVLRENGGMMGFRIPPDLAGGRYFMRVEHLALHRAQIEGEAQWYIGCVQLFIYSTGGSAKPPGVSIPGYVGSTDPGVLFDYWNNMHPTSYAIPGPAPYVSTNTGGGNRVQVGNLELNACPIGNADWCSRPLPSFTDEGSCWASVGDCWKQLKTCYDNAPPTGHIGCDRYSAICDACQVHCRNCADTHNCAGTFPGQPAKSRRQARAVHRHPLLPPITKKAILETTDIVVSSDEDKLTNARNVCEQIVSKCKENGISGLCKVFGAACRGAVQPGIIEQFPEQGGRKWQALWLYQIVCENEIFEKDKCREKFSKVVRGFE